MELSDAAKAAFLRVRRLLANGIRVVRTHEPDGFLELCRAGLLKEERRTGDDYPFSVTPEGKAIALHDLQFLPDEDRHTFVKSGDGSRYWARDEKARVAFKILPNMVVRGNRWLLDCKEVRAAA